MRKHLKWPGFAVIRSSGVFPLRPRAAVPPPPPPPAAPRRVESAPRAGSLGARVLLNKQFVARQLELEKKISTAIFKSPALSPLPAASDSDATRTLFATSQENIRMRDNDILATCGTDAAAGAAFDASPTLQREFGSDGRDGFIAYARELRRGHPYSPAPGVAAFAPADQSVPPSDAVARERFAASPALQREFGAIDTYICWGRAARGDRPRRR